MMRTGASKAIIAVFLFAASVPAQDSRPSPTGTKGAETRPAVELSPAAITACLDAVHRLESDDPAVREKAGKEILALGAGVRPYLIAALSGASIEGRLRLNDILANLPDNVEPAGLRTEPIRIDLDADGMPVRDVLRLIAKRANVQFPEPLTIDGAAPLTMKLESTPFFEALDRIAAAIGARWQQDYQGASFRWYAGVYGRPLVRYRGPFRISLTNFTRNSTMTFGGEASEQCYIYGQVDIEPGADILGLWTPPTVDGLTDDQNRSLLGDQSKQVPMFNPALGRGNFAFTIPLTVPPGDAKSIKRLGGKFIVLAPESRQSILLGIDPQQPAAEARARGIGAKVISATRNAAQLSLTIEIEKAPLIADERTRQPIQDLEVSWVTRAGEERHPFAPHTQTINGKEMLIVAPPATIAVDELVGVRLRVIAATKRTPITFEFEDVPLP